MPRCKICKGQDYVPAPPENAWQVYFKRIGRPYHVLVPCRACGGVSGAANRRALRERLEQRKRAGTFPAAAG